jgi:D-alanyl-D-alanine dipeptidase
MDAAQEFVQRLLEYPLAECGEPLCCLRERAREAGVEMVCPDGKKLGRFGRTFYVRQSLVEKIFRAAEALLARGYVLWIEDGYRSPGRQAQGARSDYCLRNVLAKVRWELNGREPTAEEVFRRMAVWTATTPKFANHTSGSALDVWLLHRRDGSRADLGAPYPEFSERTPMDSPFISAEARRHRRLLCEALAEEDFLPYPYEFWHFSHGDADYEMLAGAGRPARFGPVHWRPADGGLTPVADPLAPFITLEDIRPRLAGLLGAASAPPPEA